jgi:hypothetical protein
MRVRVDAEEQTLTLTDLGVGMTRADLINTLGIGKQQLQPSSAAPAKESEKSNGDSTDEEDDDSSDDDDEEEEGGGDDDQSEDIFQSTADQQPAKPGQQQQANSEFLKCKREDIGGFYAALCALGLGVRVGTKVKSK